VKLYKGNIVIAHRASETSLFSPEIRSIKGDRLRSALVLERRQGPRAALRDPLQAPQGHGEVPPGRRRQNGQAESREITEPACRSAQFERATSARGCPFGI